jgi:hypothetical protein
MQEQRYYFPTAAQDIYTAVNSLKTLYYCKMSWFKEKMERPEQMICEENFAWATTSLHFSQEKKTNK